MAYDHGPCRSLSLLTCMTQADQRSGAIADSIFSSSLFNAYANFQLNQACMHAAPGGDVGKLPEAYRPRLLSFFRSRHWIAFAMGPVFGGRLQWLHESFARISAESSR